MSGSGSTTGSSVWYSLDADRREAIGLILLYSNELWDHSISVTTTSKANNPNVPLRMATQFLIFEIICGLRDAETFVLNSSNECGYSGDIFYNAGADAMLQNFCGASSTSRPEVLLWQQTALWHSWHGCFRKNSRRRKKASRSVQTASTAVRSTRKSRHLVSGIDFARCRRQGESIANR